MPALALSLFLAALGSSDLDVQPGEPVPHLPGEHEFLPVIIPLLSASSDDGIGGGAILALHHFYGGVEPLRDDVSLKVFITSNLVQRHELRWESLRAFDLPLRLWLRVGFFSTVTNNFCGFGMGVTCSEDVARVAARASGLESGSSGFDEFVRHYYLSRSWRPHGDTTMRWQLRDKPHRVEVLTGWRAAWLFSGSLLEQGPYPGSLYARVFPKGEVGVTSVPQLGITIDDRDQEPAPSRGYFFEASVRAADPLWGSTWTWAGINTSGTIYDLLLDSPHTVYAGRLLIDLAVGDMPTDEIAEIGGTKSVSAFGGAWMGRGLRERRYLGKLKVVHQSEVRTDIASVEVMGVRLDFGLAAFGDVGWIGADVNDITGQLDQHGTLWPAASPLALVYGGGVGLRVVVNRAVVARAEMDASPLEQRSPSFHTPVGNAL